MQTFLIILSVLAFLMLILAAGVELTKPHLSQFELDRLAHAGDKSAADDLSRQSVIGEVLSLQRALIALFLIIFTALSIAAFGWLLGIIISIFVAVLHGAVARLGFVKKLSKKLYQKVETSIIAFIKNYPLVLKFLRYVPIVSFETPRVNSRPELQHIIELSTGALTGDEKQLLTSGLSFADKQVKEVMTPRSQVDIIHANEFLGPLTLDGLHKTGHSRLVVVKGDIDHVVGILNIRDLLTLDDKKSTTVERAMDKKVYYIRQDQSLQHALTALIKTRHHLFVVVNEFRETVGIITLEDVIESLIGRKIVDEYEMHDNLREVAKRNPNKINLPKNHVDV